MTENVVINNLNLIRISGRLNGLADGPAEAHEGFKQIMFLLSNNFTTYGIIFNELPRETKEQNQENEKIFGLIVSSFKYFTTNDGEYNRCATSTLLSMSLDLFGDAQKKGGQYMLAYLQFNPCPKITPDCRGIAIKATKSGLLILVIYIT